MNIKTLPSLANFADKSITTGLKYIMGGATYTKTGAGQMAPTQGGADYQADARSGSRVAYGLCKSYQSAEQWFTSPEFKEWVESLD